MSVFLNPRGRVAHFLAPLDNAMARYPAAGAALLGMMKATAVDITIQSFFEKNRNHDWRRTAVFASHGLLWGGAGQWFVFNRIFPRIFSGAYSTGRRNWTAVVQCVMADSLVHMPFVYMPLFYIVRESAQDVGNFSESVHKGLENWRGNVVEDTLWQVKSVTSRAISTKTSILTSILSANR